MSGLDDIFYTEERSTGGLRIEFDYLSRRVYVSSDAGMRIALTSGSSKSVKEIEAIITRLETLVEYYKDREG
jgi:hypothetical protein